MRLWVGQAVSFVGDAITMVALVVLVADLTGSAATVGGVLVARLIPTLASPLAGVFADRIPDRRAVLVVVDIIRASLVFGIIFTESMPALYALAFLLGVCQTFFNPTVRAAFPDVVGDSDLTRANALISGTFSTSYAVGPALGGVLVAAAGVDAAFLIDALSFLVSAVFLAFVPMPRPQGEHGDDGFLRELHAGFSYLKRARLPLALVVGAGLLVLAENASVPAEVFLAKETFGAGDAGYGLLVAMWGVGMILGSAVMAWLGDRANLIAAYFISLFLAGIALTATGLAPAFALALTAFTIGGLCNGVDNVVTDALLQKRVPGRFLGRVYSMLFMARTGGEVFALPVGGLIVDATGPRFTYVLSAAGITAVGFLVLVLVVTVPAKEHRDRPGLP